MSVRMVTKRVAGRTWRRLSASARLKCGTTETTRSAGLERQNSSSNRTVLRVQQADEKLQHAHGLRGAERPAFLQHQVVEVLHAQAGQLAHPVDGVEQFLQVHQPDIPSALFFHHQAESLGGGAVAAARIKENQVGVDHALTFSQFIYPVNRQ